MTKFSTLLTQMKPLRIVLALFAIVLIIFAADADTKANYEGYQVLQTLVFPALTPIIFLVLLLDALMNRVWLIDAKDADRLKYTNIIKIDLLLSGLVFIRWIPYFIEIWR